MPKIDVNPPRQQVPPSIAELSEDLFDNLENDQFFNFQLWQRSGGGEDFLAKLVVKDVTVTEAYTQDPDDSGIFCSGTFTVTMIDPALAFKQRVMIKNETGSTSTITIAATVGTVEVVTLNDEEYVTYAPRPDLDNPANSKWGAVG